MKLRITISKYHSWYLCQISLQIMLLPIQIIRMTLKSDEPFWNRRIPSVPMFIWLKSVICEMKGRQSVKTLIQNPFPFPFEFNSPPHRRGCEDIHWTSDWPLFSIRVRSNKDNAKFPKSSCMLYPVRAYVILALSEADWVLHLMYRNTSGSHQE